MKALMMLFGLALGAAASGASANTNVSVTLGQVSVLGTHTNLWFDCDVTISNQSSMPLTMTNLFTIKPGFALSITSLDGTELNRAYAWPLKSWKWTHAPGSSKEFRKLGYGAKPGRDGNVVGISLPESVKTVRLQLVGTMAGSNYEGAITSNVVQVDIR
jgi:hypothetical protein